MAKALLTVKDLAGCLKSTTGKRAKKAASAEFAKAAIARPDRISKKSMTGERYCDE
jgi:hypothetical protein